MRKFVASLSVLTIVMFALTGISLASTHSTVWSAKLTVAQEIPKQVVNTPAAHGLFTGTLTSGTLKFTLTFSNLSGAATAAHIHLGAMGVSGNILVGLCNAATASYVSTAAAHPCKSPVSGTVNVTPALQKDFGKHLLYVNVHTVKNPNGEIRGQLGT